MRKQLYYAWRGHGFTRLMAMGIFLVVSGTLLAVSLSTTSRFGAVLPIVGISFSGIGLFAMMVVATVLAIDSGNKLFSGNSAYLSNMAPVRGWKLLASRTIVIALDFIVAIAVGSGAVVAQVALLMREFGGVDFHLPAMVDLFHGVFFVESLLKIILLVFFARALCASLFAALPARPLLGILAFLGASWVWSLLDVLMIPFSSGATPGLWTNISIDPHSVGALCAYILLSALRIGAVFLATAYLMEKKLNL